MNGIVWLASYPKSGNTWFRALLTNALVKRAEPADINNLIGVSAASRQLFDDIAGLQSTDLPLGEIERLRPRVYEFLAHRPKASYLKIHDGCYELSQGSPLIPAQVTRAVIYLVRNPYDVAVSYAHHRGSSIDEIIEVMASPDHVIGRAWQDESLQLCQRVGSWSGNVTSWIDSGLPVHIVRFEDLSAAPATTVASALDFLGEDLDAAAVERAVAFSSFEEMSRQEMKRGFFERPSRERPFFRGGRVGDGARTLTEAQRKRIRDDHGFVMTRLGYGD